MGKYGEGSGLASGTAEVRGSNHFPGAVSFLSSLSFASSAGRLSPHCGKDASEKASMVLKVWSSREEGPSLSKCPHVKSQ